MFPYTSLHENFNISEKTIKTFLEDAWSKGMFIEKIYIPSRINYTGKNIIEIENIKCKVRRD